MKRSIVFLIVLSPTLALADQLNLSTGEYIMNMGDGDSMNLSTGEYIINMD